MTIVCGAAQGDPRGQWSRFESREPIGGPSLIVNLIGGEWTASSDRYDTATGTGALTIGSNARTYYTAIYYDASDTNRLVASVNLGGNGGTALTRPSCGADRRDAGPPTEMTSSQDLRIIRAP